MLTLTPQARAVAAFTVAVALLIGQLTRITLAVVLFLGDQLPSGRAGQLVIAVVQVAIAAAVFVAALVVARAGTAGWATDLAQAAVIVAALGLAVAVVGGVGSVVHGNGTLPAGAFSGIL